MLEDVLEGNFFDQEALQEAERGSKMSGRRGECAARGGLGGVDRDFGQRLWAETLDRDFGQRLWTDLMPEFSTLVPGGAADPPPRLARTAFLE